MVWNKDYFFAMLSACTNDFNSLHSARNAVILASCSCMMDYH